MEFNTLPYIAEDNNTLDFSAFTIKDSPATNFIAPYKVVAALDLSVDTKHAAEKSFSSATRLELTAPLIMVCTPSSMF